MCIILMCRVLIPALARRVSSCKFGLKGHGDAMAARSIESKVPLTCFIKSSLIHCY